MEITLQDREVRQALADYVRKEHVAPKNRKQAEITVVSVTRHQGGRASAVVQSNHA